MKKKIRFLYKPDVKGVFLSLGTTIFMFSVVFYNAITIYNGLDDNGKIVYWLHFISKIGLWILSITLFVFVLLLFKVLYKTFLGGQFIIVDRFGISSPKSMIGENIKVLYQDISSIHLNAIGNQYSIVITHDKGELIISEVLLESRETFMELASLIKLNKESLVN